MEKGLRKQDETGTQNKKAISSELYRTVVRNTSLQQIFSEDPSFPIASLFKSCYAKIVTVILESIARKGGHADVTEYCHLQQKQPLIVQLALLKFLFMVHPRMGEQVQIK